MSTALLNSALLAAPLAAAIWIVLRLVPRRLLNAATRYLILWIAFAVTLALPLAFMHPHRAPSPRAKASAMVAIRAVQIQAATTAEPPLPARLPLEIPAVSIRYLAIAWALWSVILLSRLSIGLRAIHLLRARGVDMGGCAAGFAIPVVLADVSSPVVAGPIRRSVLIPSKLAGRISAGDLQRVILHEAAHLARRDDLAKLAEQFLIALFPWNLAARFLARRMDLEREIACDDRVVEATGDAHAYADCLTRVVELCGGVRPSYAAAMAGHRGHLSHRVEALIANSGNHGRRLRFLRSSPFAAAILVLAFFAVRVPQFVAFAAAPVPSPVPVTAATATPPEIDAPPAAPAPAPVPAPVPPPRPAPQTAPDDSGARHLIFYLDLPSLSGDDVDRAIAASRKFIETKLSATDLLAIMAARSSGGVAVLQDFTNNRDRLRAALENLPYDSKADRSTDYSVAALTSTLRMLTPLKFKKSLLCLTSGTLFPADQATRQALVNDAVRANVAFYLIDTRGLVR